MRAYDLIRRKRNGGELTDQEIRELIAGYTRGDVPDYQVAALLMAIYFRGLDGRELATWTEAMLHSGEVVELPGVPGRKVDKHSTGGVGDKVSICLAPLVAACGVPVPMVSGRGLGHTGGTLDKLEAIPGFRVDLDTDRYREVVRELGVCLIGQTDTIAPADRKMYALRDVTATVESVPLISSSILSKKLAEGIDALVLDVKVGRGAFMKTLEDARVLAETMVDIGTRMGKQVVALLTGMEQPLGRAVGNALETIEAIEVLKGGGPDDLVTLTVELAAEMLVLGEVSPTLEAGREKARATLEDGSGLERFRRLVAAQGGDPETLDDYGRFAQARRTEAVTAATSGFVTAIDAEAVGVGAMRLGAGRATKESEIDPAVGVILERKVGDRIEAGEPLCVLHVNEDRSLASVVEQVRSAFQIGEAEPAPLSLLLDRVGG